MKKKDEIYLQIFSIDDNHECLAPIETVVSLFVLRYCESEIDLRFVQDDIEPEIRGYKVDTSNFTYRTFDKNEIPHYASFCELPNVIVNDDTVVAGLCAILRQIVKNTVSHCPEHHCCSLLGFKDSCLAAPAETSVWTKFCEIDVPTTLKKLTIVSEIPETLARFEAHMSEPVRLHNVYKYTMSKKFALKNTTMTTTTSNDKCIPEHTYAEGSYLTLSDIIIFICFHVFFNYTSEREIRELLPLTFKWYDRIMENPKITNLLDFLIPEVCEFFLKPYVLPVVERQSLYKSDPKRYKPRNRIYTRQEDVENSLSLIDRLTIDRELNVEPYGTEVTINWKEIPYEATPEGGKLPIVRLKRKYQQLENLCRPVLKLARKNDVIVDFCSGSGHLGILIAHLLPDCTILLLENKEESLNRSKERVKKLSLGNVKFYQCNLDYFKGDFQIGTSLHACGVATDLVIQNCLRKNAIFVSCPCCYGSVHDCHHLGYPRSQIFKKNIEYRDYLVIGHCADQTHDAENAKTAQGNECMAIIDTDRKLQAEEFGYVVYFAKLVPDTCTPKNHLLVGIPKSRIL